MHICIFPADHSVELLLINKWRLQDWLEPLAAMPCTKSLKSKNIVLVQLFTMHCNFINANQLKSEDGRLLIGICSIIQNFTDKIIKYVMHLLYDELS